MKKPVLIVCLFLCFVIFSASAHESTCNDCSIKIKPLGQFEVTYYTSYGTKTATGTTPELGVCAVDPCVIPLGSTIYIEYEDGSIRECRAEDTGGVVKGNIVDVWLPSEEQCIQEGRDICQVHIKRGGNK